MDIFNLVDYEKLHSIQLKHPTSDEPLGVTMEIRSLGSAVAEKVLMEHTNKQIEKFAKNKLPTAEQGKRAQLEKLAACIASWDWNENSFGDEKFDKTLTMSRAIRVLNTQWIFRQVEEAALDERNFLPPSSGTSTSE